jgi:CBS domain-containing protein
MRDSRKRVRRRGVIACDPDASLRTVARAMESHGIHCVLVAGLASDGGDKRAADVARTEAPTIEPSAPLADAARTMAEHRVTHLVVVEPECERAVGVVSSSDIVRSLALGVP